MPHGRAARWLVDHCIALCGNKVVPIPFRSPIPVQLLQLQADQLQPQHRDKLGMNSDKGT